MAFELSKFEAEVALKLILTDQLPAIAREAMEAGFDGPSVLRMAILEPVAGWEVDQALIPMLKELGCKQLSHAEAALQLSRLRAQRIARTGEDPLTSLPYFEQLASKGDYPEELFELANLDDLEFLFSDEEKRARVREALEELLDQALREKRRCERQAAWEQELAGIRNEWPYVLNSLGGVPCLRSDTERRFRTYGSSCRYSLRPGLSLDGLLVHGMPSSSAWP